MIHLLKSNAYLKFKSAANTILYNLQKIKIDTNETFDQFGKRLWIMYTTCLRNMIRKDPSFLPRYFIRGLDVNFNYTRELINIGSLNWSN